MNFRSEIRKITFVGWTFEESQTTDCTHVSVHGRRHAIVSPDERVKWNETSLHCLVLNHLQQIVHIWRSREGGYPSGGRLVCPDVSAAGSCKFPWCLMCVCVCAGCVLYDIQANLYIYIYINKAGRPHDTVILYKYCVGGLKEWQVLGHDHWLFFPIRSQPQVPSSSSKHVDKLSITAFKRLAQLQHDPLNHNFQPFSTWHSEHGCNSLFNEMLLDDITDYLTI